MILLLGTIKLLFTIDSEFDEMRESAYNTILSHYLIERDLHEIVNNFIRDHYYSE
jgi:hypothetical protein